MRCYAVATLLFALLGGRPLPAQGLREQISSLFILGPGQDPLFLAGSADPSNPATIQAHGDHFVPAAVSANGSIISFLTEAVGGSLANVPLGATSGSETFQFVGGVPVQTSTSAGPVFAERAQTLGRGRVLAGINHTGYHFESLRGVDLHNIQLTFTHENVDFPGCDSTYGGPCREMGIPVLENDIMPFHLSLDIDVRVTALYVTYGVFDRLDVGPLDVRPLDDDARHLRAHLDALRGLGLSRVLVGRRHRRRLDRKHRHLGRRRRGRRRLPTCRDDERREQQDTTYRAPRPSDGAIRA